MNSIFQNKIDRCLDIANNGISVMRKPYLSCSWGKDSVLTLWLVLQVCPQIQVIYLNSTYAFPDNYAIRDKLLSEWHITNYLELHGDEDALKLIREHGLGDISMDLNSMKKRVGGKKSIFNHFAKENGYDGNFWGLRADESKARLNLFKAKSPLFFDETQELWRCAPIAWIESNEIFDILIGYNIPYSAIYDKCDVLKREQIRNSSWLTTKGANSGRIVWLRKHYPELYFKLAKEFPEVKSYT